MPNIKKYKATEMKKEPIENQIIIHHHVLQKFLKQGKDYANLLALYSFYIYHAQLQKTNQPLVTDDFTRKGMNWAIDRVKKTKKILKEMKLIEVVQHRQYYYVHLFFIYTKKKIGEILGNYEVCQKSTKTKETFPKMVKKSQKGDAKLKPSVLKQWIDHCDKHGIGYNQNNLKHWEKKVEKRLTIDQQEAIYTAIKNQWKNFYMKPVSASKYHKFLGQSLRLEKDCDSLLDIAYRNKSYVYQFKNIKITTTAPPLELFKRYGYKKQAPIISKVQSKIMSLVKRF